MDKMALSLRQCCLCTHGQEIRMKNKHNNVFLYGVGPPWAEQSILVLILHQLMF